MKENDSLPGMESGRGGGKIERGMVQCTLMEGCDGGGAMLYWKGKKRGEGEEEEEEEEGFPVPPPPRSLSTACSLHR